MTSSARAVRSMSISSKFVDSQLHLRIYEKADVDGKLLVKGVVLRGIGGPKFHGNVEMLSKSQLHRDGGHFLSDQGLFSCQVSIFFGAPLASEVEHLTAKLLRLNEGACFEV